tara:strand:- start:50 stop:364 length:315 start_codon:yes stop_codon:yes gene_type:complete
MSKYKNKDGIELNYTSLRGDYHTSLVREVINEAIKILRAHNQYDSNSKTWAITRGVSFLKENFDITKERSDEWRIEQFNRNRAVEDQVHSIQEMSDAVEDMGKE